jgi:hypothetical protein
METNGQRRVNVHTALAMENKERKIVGWDAKRKQIATEDRTMLAL